MLGAWLCVPSVRHIAERPSRQLSSGFRPQLQPPASPPSPPTTLPPQSPSPHHPAFTLLASTPQEVHIHFDLPEYSIEKDHTEIAKIKTKFRLTNPELTGQVKGKELKINGNLFGNDFDILVGGAVIGHVDKEFGFGSDHYHIRSFDPDMQDVVTALAVICDTVADKEEESDS